MRDLSIRLKLWGVVGLAAVAIFCAAGTALWFNYQRMYQDRIDSLRAVVESGISIAKSLQDEVAAGKMSAEEAQNRFKQTIVSVRYFGAEYLFAYTFDLVGFAHPSPEIMGKDASGLRDSNGNSIVAILREIVKSKGDGTYAYEWLRPGQTTTSTKLAYVRGFAPWNIFVGTGVFVDDIWQDFVATFWKLMSVVISLTIPIIAAIALTGRDLSNRSQNAKFSRWQFAGRVGRR